MMNAAANAVARAGRLRRVAHRTRHERYTVASRSRPPRARQPLAAADPVVVVVVGSRPRGFGVGDLLSQRRAFGDGEKQRRENDEDDEAATGKARTSEGKTTTDLRDAVRNIRREKDASDDETSKREDGTSDSSSSPFLETAKGYFSTFSDEVGKTWQELLESGRPKGINKKIVHKKSPSAVDAEEYEGTTAMMVIDESENMGAWEKMQRRLSEAPIIQGILGASHEVFEKSGARKVKERVDDIREDATEAWETSQNPWVYRISSVYDTITAETDLAVATRELQKLDPDFTIESFKHDAVEHTIPEIMRTFLKGRVSELEPWLGEAVYKRLTAENQVRKKEGLIVDSNLLGIFNAEVIAVEMDKVEHRSPIILLHYMCQQINCVRNKDGEVVEGQEDDIKANSYLMAFQREYDEEDGALNWKIVDFRFNGAIAWI